MWIRRISRPLYLSKFETNKGQIKTTKLLLISKSLQYKKKKVKKNYTWVPNSTGQQKAEVEWNSFKSVLVGTLDAVEVGFLVWVHGWILDIILLPGRTNLEGQPHVEDKSSSGCQNHVSMFFGQNKLVDHLVRTGFSVN